MGLSWNIPDVNAPSQGTVIPTPHPEMASMGTPKRGKWGLGSHQLGFPNPAGVQ